VADAVASSAAVVSAKDLTGGSAVGRWGRSIPQFDGDVQASIDTAVLVTSRRNALSLGCVPKLKVYFSLAFPFTLRAVEELER
jgi:hypothetical protein